MARRRAPEGAYRAAATTAGVLISAAVGCLGPIELAGYRCDGDRCAEGFECNPITLRCVEHVAASCDGAGTCPDDTTTGDPCGVDGGFLPCVSGAVGCEAGCRVCEGGAWSECHGGCTPTDEIPCNGVDEDCDGEDAVLTGLDAHCAGCGDDCAQLPQVTSASCLAGDPPACGARVCETSWTDADLDPRNGCECTPTNGGVEVPCDGVDQDCDGLDAGAGVVTACASCTDDCTTLPDVQQVDCDTAGPVSCVVVSCQAGHGDVDGDPTNGCECDEQNGGV